MSNDEPMTARIVWLFSVVLGVVRPSYARNHGMPPGRHCIFSPTSARLQCNATKCLTAKAASKCLPRGVLDVLDRSICARLLARFSILPRPAAIAKAPQGLSALFDGAHKTPRTICNIVEPFWNSTLTSEMICPLSKRYVHRRTIGSDRAFRR